MTMRPGGWLKPEAFSDDESKVFVLDSRDGGTQALGISDLRMTNVEELYRDSVTDIRNFMSDEDDGSQHKQKNQNQIMRHQMPPNNNPQNK